MMMITARRIIMGMKMQMKITVKTQSVREVDSPVCLPHFHFACLWFDLQHLIEVP